MGIIGGFPWQRAATQSFDVFLDAHLNKRLNKHRNCRWFETLWCPCDVTVMCFLYRRKTNSSGMFEESTRFYIRQIVLDLLAFKHCFFFFQIAEMKLLNWRPTDLIGKAYLLFIVYLWDWIKLLLVHFSKCWPMLKYIHSTTMLNDHLYQFVPATLN